MEKTLILIPPLTSDAHVKLSVNSQLPESQPAVTMFFYQPIRTDPAVLRHKAELICTNLVLQ